MYIKKTYYFKNSIEVEKIHTRRYGKKGGKNNPKVNKTPEAMAEHNRQQAIDKLRRIIKANFEDGFHMVLTYNKKDRPDARLAYKQKKNFLERLKYHMKKMGYELKYIEVTEYEGKAIHHHLVINSFPELIELVREQWPFGQANFTPIYKDEDVSTLAEYLIKERDKTFRDDPFAKKRYSRSRNLIVPEPKVEIIKSNSFKKQPTVPKGYTLDVDSLVYGVSAKTGYEYQKYTLKRVRRRI